MLLISKDNELPKELQILCGGYNGTMGKPCVRTKVHMS